MIPTPPLGYNKLNLHKAPPFLHRNSLRFSTGIYKETGKEEYQKRTSEKPTIVIQTIVDKLFRYKNPNESVYRNRETKEYYKANLSDAFLRGVDFRDTNLQGADLRNANLQRADLYKANLQGAYLKDAKLQGAYLIDTDLWGAYLWDAKLQGAKLINVVLLEERITGADFRGVQGDNHTNIPDTIKKALKEGLLITDLSGVTVYDESRAIKWTLTSENLKSEEVQQLAKELGIIKDEDEPTLQE